MMKNYFFALSLGLGGALCLAQNAQAQQASCADRSMVVERLQDRFGESRQSVGLGRNNAVVEVFASATTGTWTIIVTMPTGMTCLVASGESWEEVAEQMPIPGNDA